MLGVRAAGAVIVSALLLTGCSGGDDQPEADESSAPAASASPSPTASPTATAPADAPAGCADLGLEAGSDVEGPALASCLTAGLEEAGSGVEEVSGDDLTGTVRFTYGRDVAYAGQLESSDGTLEITVVPPTTWVKLGEKWVEAKADGDPEQTIAADVGGALAAAADPAAVLDLVRSSSRWAVQAETEDVELADGTTVTAWRLESAPFTSGGAQVEGAVVWLDESLRPVGTQATVTSDGAASTTTRHFTDLGEPQQVGAPQ